jgi:hypothetical protein
VTVERCSGIDRDQQGKKEREITRVCMDVGAAACTRVLEREVSMDVWVFGVLCSGEREKELCSVRREQQGERRIVFYECRRGRHDTGMGRRNQEGTCSVYEAEGGRTMGWAEKCLT